MNFWILAIALLAVPAAIIAWPLVAGSAKDRITALFLFLMVPLAGILMYQGIGTPEAIGLEASQAARQAEQEAAHSTQMAQMNDLVGSLQQRLQENPDDAEGWLVLGRSLKSMQRFVEAEAALRNANRLLPDNAVLMVELAEAILFASGNTEIGPEPRQLIGSALAIDPQLQKGLWLTGMIAAQDGDDAAAIGHWQILLGLLDPASGAASSVNEQIEMAQMRMAHAGVEGFEQEAGMPPTAAPAQGTGMASTVAQESVADSQPEPVQPVVTQPAGAGFSIPVTVSIDSEMAAVIPGGGILFIFIHPEGGAGMPLAVKRLPPRGFPMALNFTDADLLQPGNSLENFEKLDVSARISASGSVMRGSGDIQADRVTVDTKAVTTIALNLDQRVP